MARKINNCKLPKDDILRGKKFFDQIFTKGSVISGSNISILYIKANSRKIGFVVSKNVKKAVIRNRHKRLLREIYRLNKSNFPEKAHIILLSKGKNDNFFILQKEVLELLNKITNI